MCFTYLILTPFRFVIDEVLNGDVHVLASLAGVKITWDVQQQGAILTYLIRVN